MTIAETFIKEGFDLGIEKGIDLGIEKAVLAFEKMKMEVESIAAILGISEQKVVEITKKYS